MKLNNIILNSVFIAALCFLGACSKNTLPPAISSCWQVSGLTEDGWIEYINKPITDMGLLLSGKDIPKYRKEGYKAAAS